MVTIMKIFKKSLVLFLTFSLLFADASISWAGKVKKSSKGGSKRAGNTKAGKKSGKGLRQASNKGGRKSVRQASGGGRKSVRASSARRASAIAATTATVATTSTGTTSTDTKTTSTASVKGVACRSAYSECMDIQIKGFLSKYSYLGENPAVEAMQETGDAFRCIYYSKGDGSTISSSMKTPARLASSNSSASGQDVNALYYAYNFYCKPETKTGESGQPLNICTWDTSNNANATKKSYMFYKAVLDKLEADELTILNFTSTKLYETKFKTAMEAAGATNIDLSTYQISSSDVNDMLKDLGMDTSENTSEQQLFSVNVVPPQGAGSLNPKGIFQKAHEICMGNSQLPTTTNSSLSEDDLEEMKKQIRILNGSSCQSLADEYISYYQTGVWEGCPSGYKYSSTENACVNKTDKTDITELEEVDTGFLSAKASCNSFEQALISSREQAYAKFQDQLTNYLNENVAQLIKKEAKKQSTISNAFGNLYKADADNKANVKIAVAEAKKIDMQAESDARKFEAEAKILDAKSRVEVSKAESEVLKAQTEAEKIRKENLKELIKESETKLKKQCNSDADALTLDGNYTKNLADLKVCISKEGKVSSYTAGCDNEILCIDEIGLDASTITEARVAAITWKPYELGTSGGSLPSGFYRVTVAGAKGSNGSSYSHGANIFASDHRGGYGGNGDLQQKVFSLSTSKSYTYTVGNPSTFKIEGTVDLTAPGGGNGGNASRSSRGSDGAPGGNGMNPFPAYVKLEVQDTSSNEAK